MATTGVPTMKLGIDPGIDGAIVLIDGENCIRIWDMPTMEKTHGKGRQVNAYLLADYIREAMDTARTAEKRIAAYVERVGAMPGQGVTSMFSFGRSAGIVDGVLAALGVPVHQVTPSRWKRSAGLTGRTKDASRSVALQLFPEVSTDLTRKRDVGRADALLIAWHGSQTRNCFRPCATRTSA